LIFLARSSTGELFGDSSAMMRSYRRDNQRSPRSTPPAIVKNIAFPNSLISIFEQ
jgi:hypothetical protein